MPHTRKDIDCSKLNKLYITRRFPLLKIGKLLGYSSRTIEIRAKECGIKLRKPGCTPPKISDETLKRLYLKKRLSSRKIATIYKCSYSYIDNRIKLLEIPRRNLSSAHTVTKRCNFSGDLQEKAYLIGFAIGDLRVRKMYKNSETILVDCGSTKAEQIKLIRRLFKKYGRIWISKPKQNNKTQIECGVNKSFSFLMKKYQTFPSWIEANSILRLSALAGFIDAEGSFYITKRGEQGHFSIGNYNQRILKQINSWIIKLGLKTRFFLGVKKGYKGKDGYLHNDDYWILSILRKKDLLLFTKKMFPYLKHKDRLLGARKILANIKERNEKYGFIGMKHDKLQA